MINNKELIEELYFCASQFDACYLACSGEKEVNKIKLQCCMTLSQESNDICRLEDKLFRKGL
jgi:hypothetical protein